jgi:putative transposase
MPWKTKSELEQRLDLIRQWGVGKLSKSALCREFKVSRTTAYKWVRRYRQKGLAGLRDQSRRPRHLSGKTDRVWLRRLRSLRLRHPTWGARKLWHVLARRYEARHQPASATISRWLKRWGLAKGKRRMRRGPMLCRHPLRKARRCHEVWTVDFKGWYRTADGQRVEPLTVRDLHSRYGLAIVLLGRQTVEETQAAMRKIFRRHGVPQCIRCDNGSPFGGGGHSRLSRLSAWWVKLGIAVDFITPGCPQENGAHEQFHRVYKAEWALRQQKEPKRAQRQINQWLRYYNERRPHEGIGMRYPVELFRRNHRRLRRWIPPWHYPAGWDRCWVKGNGEITWAGKRHYVGEAFVRDYVGLCRSRGRNWKVYFGPIFVGLLNPNDQGSLRMVHYTRRCKPGPGVPARSARLHARA